MKEDETHSFLYAYFFISDRHQPTRTETFVLHFGNIFIFFGGGGRTQHFLPCRRRVTRYDCTLTAIDPVHITRKLHTSHTFHHPLRRGRKAPTAFPFWSFNDFSLSRLLHGNISHHSGRLQLPQ